MGEVRVQSEEEKTVKEREEEEVWMAALAPPLKKMKRASVWIGCDSVSGRRNTMEDCFSVVPSFTQHYHLCAVFDGHGGHQVANYCRERLHVVLAEKLMNHNIQEFCQDQWQATFTDTFLKIDAEVAGKPEFSPNTGSTAIVSLISSSHVIVANCGDSRAVLCRGKESVALSIDHKPDREDEHERIEASGGTVIDWGCPRVYGVLAVSRSIGDSSFKPAVIAEPEIKLINRQDEDECIIIASDGLWDVFSNLEACNLVKKFFRQWYNKHRLSQSARLGDGRKRAAKAAAKFLTMSAMKKGSSDNITCFVIDLKSERGLTESISSVS